MTNDGPVGQTQWRTSHCIDDPARPDWPRPRPIVIIVLNIIGEVIIVLIIEWQLLDN